MKCRITWSAYRRSISSDEQNRWSAEKKLYLSFMSFLNNGRMMFSCCMINLPSFLYSSLMLCIFLYDPGLRMQQHFCVLPYLLWEDNNNFVIRVKIFQTVIYYFCADDSFSWNIERQKLSSRILTGLGTT